MNRIRALPLCAAAFWLCLSAATRAAPPPAVHGNLTYDGIPDRPVDSAVLDAYLNSRQATPLGFTPKGELLIRTRFGETEQLHLIAGPLGARRQITFLREPVTDAAFSPDPSRAAFFFESPQSGSLTQIYYQHLGEPRAKRLTDGKSQNGGALWSNTGRELAFYTTARNGASYDIDVIDPESGTLPHLAVTGDGGFWRPLDWSPDDRKLLILQHVSSQEDHLFVVELDGGQKREVAGGAAKAAIRDAKFSRDGTGVYVVSDRDGDNARLSYLNIFTGEKLDISPPRSAFDVAHFALSRDGRYLAYATDEGAGSKLELVDLKSHQDLTAPRLPFTGIVDSLSFDRDGKRLVFGLASAAAPRDAYVLDLASGRLEAWTASETGPLDRAGFVLPRLTQFPTFDRSDGKPRQIPLYVYEPATPGPHPVLMLLHDPPAAEFRPAFDPWIQYLVKELGYAVLAPNVRGSSGYGKTYAALDQGMLREDAVKDVGALLVWLGLDPRFDAKHVVVSGGYLALATLVNYGDRLRGAVDFAGISDFIGYMGTTAPYLQSLARAEYGDERDTDARAYLRRISPLTGADRITKPLLQIHGRDDVRVPLLQSDELANRLRSRGGTVWILQAADEGHEFTRLEDRQAAYRTVAAFLTSLK